jgi:hypothetical protein
MYAIRYDGFVQSHRPYDSLEQAREVYKSDSKNKFLYEYDCSVVEIVDGKVVRTVSFEELK